MSDFNNNGGNKGPWGQGSGGSNNDNNNNNEDEIDQIIRKSQEKIKQFMPGGKKGGGGKSSGPDTGKLVLIVGLFVFAVWVLSATFFTVNAKEKAVVLRFGEYVRTVGPGLRIKFPAPIETVTKLKVTDRYTEKIGYGYDVSQSSKRSFRSSSVSGREREILMLTGDENIININFEVQWQIVDAHKFLFNVNDQQKTIRNAAESAMREVIGTTPINEILSEGRKKAQLEAKILLQEILDSYNAGVSIEEINMKGVPPLVVDEAFKDVQAAKINKQEAINKAIAYSNEVIPIARGQAQEKIQKAEGYKAEVVAQAEGQADRFLQIYKQYLPAKKVTRDRIYIETMESVLKGMDKLVVDLDENSAVPYLPLGELHKKPKAN